MNNIEKLVSKKLIVAIAYFILILATGFGLDVPESNMQALDAIFLAYLGGQSFVDAVVAYRTKTTTSNAKN